MYTWDEIYELADGSACGSPALRAKDSARNELRKYIFMETGNDIEKDEIPEESIDTFLDKHGKMLLFDKTGHLRALIEHVR